MEKDKLIDEILALFNRLLDANLRLFFTRTENRHLTHARNDVQVLAGVGAETDCTA